MSMNIPIIASVSKGFWGDEVLENNKDIVLLKNDAQLWKNEIIELMKNTQKRKPIYQCLRKAKNNYKYEDLFERFFDILKNYALTILYSLNPSGMVNLNEFL